MNKNKKPIWLETPHGYLECSSDCPYLVSDGDWCENEELKYLSHSYPNAFDGELVKACAKKYGKI